MEKRHRIFVAINLPEDIKKSMVRHTEKWNDLPANWTPKDNFHITLVFLGDLTDVELADVCEAVKQIAETQKVFSINLDKIVYGPPEKIPPRFVWAVGEKSQELQELKNNLEDLLLEKVNFRPEGRGFTPHITLARISEFAFRQIEPEERPEINEGTDFIFSVESIEVMESESKRGGPQYTIIESHELQN